MSTSNYRLNLPALLTLSLSIGSMLVLTNVETATAGCKKNCRPGIGKAVSKAGGGTGIPDGTKDIKMDEKIKIESPATLAPAVIKVPTSAIRKSR
jgi:hypothetical protein